MEDQKAKFTISQEEIVKALLIVCSAHVDDLKLACKEDVADAFMDALEQEFGKLTR